MDIMGEIEQKVEELVDENTRKELNKIASKEGIKDPESLPRKKAVAREIVKAKRAKEHVKKPIGLSFESED